MSCFNYLSIVFVKSLKLARLNRHCKCGGNEVGFNLTVAVSATRFAFDCLYYCNTASLGGGRQ